jgi:protein-arginine kinase
MKNSKNQILVRTPGFLSISLILSIFLIAAIPSINAIAQTEDLCLGKTSKHGGIALGDKKDTKDFCHFTYKNYPFTKEHSNNFTSKILTPILFEKMKDLETDGGYTLSNSIQSGVEDTTLKVGMSLGDEQSYVTFQEIVNPMIERWHGYDTKNGTHKTNLNCEELNFPAELQEKFKKYVSSTRIRVARNISGHPFPAGATPADRKVIEDILKNSIKDLQGTLKGKYYSLEKFLADEELMKQGILSKEDQASIKNAKKFMFQIPPVGVFLASGAASDFPHYRGVYVSDNNEVALWINEEDHIRIISMKEGGDLNGAINNFSSLHKAITQKLQEAGKSYAFNDKLGFLSSCCSNIGTSMRMSFWIDLPKLSAGENMELMEKIADKYGLQIRPQGGEHTKNEGSVWDISNKRRLGLTEVELIQGLIDGAQELIEMEESIKSSS